ncbi:arylamine N-acetyltransferase family protein [Jongsikchunia kroppenstedtii]|uniref:arylamine N-acetyltransferase family protein n=1 Tax=Jongsikchunia kroppenstedtii TaxID=1121721 RepID=UPI0003675323|nr:arylamine N-acetyltransferase [Jongsikchunia kroppenstedtii]
MTDVQRYLRRIGYRGTPTPDRALLDEFLRLHVEAIPFENVTSYAPGPSPDGAVDLDPDAVADKLLGAVDGGPRRGGYCMEHATLLQAVLPQLGFAVRGAWGRVLSEPGSAPGTRTHFVTIVTLGGRNLLVDPGNGGMTPTGTIDLDDRGAVQSTPHDRYRVVSPAEAGVHSDAAPDADLVLQLQLVVDGERSWRSLYTLDLSPVAAGDVAVANWFVSTSPASPFTGTLMAALATEGARITLADTVFRRRSAGAVDKRTLAGADDLRAAFDELHIDASPEAIAAVSARLFAGGER